MDRVDVMMMQYSQQVEGSRRPEFQMAYHAQRKNRNTALLLSLFLGWLGIDRFYIGQPALGVIKLLTLGVFGLWSFIDWFLIMGATDSQNERTLLTLATMYPKALPPAGHTA